MKAILEQVIEHLRGAWRFRWLALTGAWAVCVIGWVTVLMIPDTYEAAARVFVDTRTPLKQITEGITVESSVDTQIQRIRQALLGAPQLEKVAREAELDLEVVSPQQRQAMVGMLRDRIQINGGIGREGGSSGLYVISYKDRDRERSLRVVDRLLDTFVEGALGGKREGSETAQRFLVDQIAEYERRLSEAEDRLAAFKKQNVGLMPGAQGDYFSRLQGEMESAGKAEADLRIALQRREEIERQLRGEQPFVDGGSSSGFAATAAGSTETATRIRETQARLDETLLRFTDKHPDVIALRATLVDLQARQKAEIEAVRRGDPGAATRSGMSANPVYQSIQLQLNQAAVEIAAHRAELADRRKKIADLRKLVDTAPEVEAEFGRLNRDYDVTRAQRQALVERLERARFSEEADQTGIVRFEVLDPPTASFKPAAPNRPLLIVGVLIAGLGFGGALAYVLHQIKPVFSTARQLSEITGLPVLGVVSMSWIERFRAQRSRGAFVYAGSIALLVVAAAAVYVVHGRAGLALRGLLA